MALGSTHKLCHFPQLLQGSHGWLSGSTGCYRVLRGSTGFRSVHGNTARVVEQPIRSKHQLVCVQKRSQRSSSQRLPLATLADSECYSRVISGLPAETDSMIPRPTAMTSPMTTHVAEMCRSAPPYHSAASAPRTRMK